MVVRLKPKPKARRAPRPRPPARPHRSEEFWRQIVDVLPMGVMVWRLAEIQDDASLTFVAANPAASAALGREFHDASGKRISEVLPALRSETVHALAEVVRSSKRVEL